ncbi:MAG: dihydropyrimidine dehydrogenase [Clostridiales bacterium GWB2_37_7]|nr:MAG: dihydropyrimidine dehydrogenase [Clostridiales bacterium GWB2_37_7]
MCKDYLEETKRAYSPLNAIEEASRCLLCHDAPCSKACPAGTNPERFIRSIRFRNVSGAVETIREGNILGACCARVCPYDKLCEEACSRTGIDRPIDIGGLQRYAMDFEKSFCKKTLESPETKLQKVAVIGSGPAGLAAAAVLSLKGYKATIFEGKEKAGGWLTYGIVPSRLPQEIVDYEVDYIKSLGVEFKMNTRIGTDLTIDQLKEDGYEAICVTVGLQSPVVLSIPGVELSGVTTAVDFLSAAKPTQGAIEIPNDVIIIGGGDVAMDCATTAKLLGAKKVTIIYRRTVEEMPATKAELEHVNGLGICVLPSFKPVEILGENGKVKAIKAVGLDWLDRNTFAEVPESNIQLKAELVIQAIGQKAEEISYTGLEVNGKGLAVSDQENGKTNIEYVFAAGDIVNGGKTVVEAVARGKAAANSIHEYLSHKKNCSHIAEEAAVQKEGER